MPRDYRPTGKFEVGQMVRVKRKKAKRYGQIGRIVNIFTDSNLVNFSGIDEWFTDRSLEKAKKATK